VVILGTVQVVLKADTTEEARIPLMYKRKARRAVSIVNDKCFPSAGFDWKTVLSVGIEEAAQK
jgi:hypothetical protein